ncbi:MAG: cation-transporting P-type ATPase [Burkholderiaceae bacterium]|nr:cation-transporting P-type ATPase [Burkholderiaceae bacterium]
MKIHLLSVDEALASLGSGPDGLTHAKVRRRQKEYGLNRVEEIPGEPLLLRFFKEFTHFFALILWVAAGLCFFSEWHDPDQGWSKVGFAIIGVIVLNGSFAFWQEWRIEKTLAALKDLLPHQADVLREGAVAVLPVEQLVPGDILLLEAGDNIPADCRLIEAYGVRVNNASVTGESLPQARDAAPMAHDGEPLHADNVLLAGTSLVAGQAKAVVYATGMHTEFGRIAHLLQTGVELASPLKQEMVRLSRIIALLAVVIGFVFFVAGWLLVGISIWKAFIFAVGIIVALVPEGLLATLTLSLVLGTQRMAKRNVLIRYLPSVETLGSATVICTDKTGTLTQNRMTVKQVFFAGGNEARAPESIAPAEADTHWPFLLTALFCHDLRNGSGTNGAATLLGDPMEIALVAMAKKILPVVPAYPKLHEIPFDTTRLRLSTVQALPDGAQLFCKGAPEAVLPLCSRVKVDGELLDFTDELRAQLRRRQEEMAGQGLRVLALASRRLDDGWQGSDPEREMVFAGLVGLEDPPRPEVPEAIRRCHEAGIRVIMVTGDHPHTAAAIAREIGMTHTDAVVVLTGEQLRTLSDTQLMLALDAEEIIFARIAADQKRRIVDMLKAKAQIVAVTGDGVNDAPALKSAHIGIAMGISGTDVAKEAADMVLLDDNFASIVSAIEEGRAVFDNIRKFLTYILTSNVPELIPYLAFTLFNVPLGLTLLQVLLIDLGTDSLPAVGLGAEKPDPQVMQRPPRPKEERLFNWQLALRAFLLLGLMESLAAMAAFFFVLGGGGWEYGQELAAHDPLYLRATTACLVAVVVMQVMNVFLCRSNRRSVFALGWFRNPVVLAGVAFEIALLLFIVYAPWGQALFATAPLAASAWLFVLPFALAMLLLDELRKRISFEEPHSSA